MRAAGDIVLLAVYELGHQPLSLASPAAFLKRAGFSPVAIDLSIENLDISRVSNAKLVAISAPMHTAMRLAVPVAREIRSINPNAHICFYGLYAYLNAKYLLSSVADSVLAGEYEQALVDLALRLEAQDSAQHDRSGIFTSGPPSPILTKLNFMLPHRESLPPIEMYAALRHEGRLRKAGYVEATRGCLHTCTHCPIPPVYGGRFFVVPKDVVVEDIRQQVNAGATHITFGDPDFLNGPGHVLKILRAVHEEFPFLTFDATIKIEHIIEKRDLFTELRELGCIFVVSAVESVNEDVLRNLEKGHTRQDVEEALSILRQNDIEMNPSLLPFTPWETLDSFIELLHFVEDHDLIPNVSPVHYSIRLLVPPGSLVIPKLEEMGVLGTLDEESFTYVWSHPDTRMDELYHEISVLVQEMVSQNKTNYEIFDRVKAVAYAKAGLPIPDAPVRNSREAPGLTEPWYCCAEPLNNNVCC